MRLNIKQVYTFSQRFQDHKAVVFRNIEQAPGQHPFRLIDQNLMGFALVLIIVFCGTTGPAPRCIVDIADLCIREASSVASSRFAISASEDLKVNLRNRVHSLIG